MTENTAVTLLLCKVKWWTSVTDWVTGTCHSVPRRNCSAAPNAYCTVRVRFVILCMLVVVSVAVTTTV
jgi:hypothetical protein